MAALRLLSFIFIIISSTEQALAENPTNLTKIPESSYKYEGVVASTATSLNYTTDRLQTVENDHVDKIVNLEHVLKILPKKNDVKNNEYHVVTNDYDKVDENKQHPCKRVCQEGKSMTCKYEFVIEYYSTMSDACLNCPYNKTDCDLEHCVPGDGVERTILVANRQMPGPTIEVCLGDTIEVIVDNQLLDISTSIHWHGILQKGSPYMDGVPFVTQCPIGPQSSFQYRFIADSPGTHIWHSHSVVQRGDGLYGPLVVKVPQSLNPHAHLYDFDLSEHTFTVMDWEHVFSADKYIRHVHGSEDNKPTSLLVNGKGRLEEFEDGEKILFTPIEKFTVKQGYRYRFRLINAGFLNCPIEMTIDNHNISVIASDGGDLHSTEATKLISLAGERYDFVIVADKPVKNYWMRFKGLLDCEPKKSHQIALLHYEGADDNEPEEDVSYETISKPGLTVNAINVETSDESTMVLSELSSAIDYEDDVILKDKPDFKFYIPFDFYPVEFNRIQDDADYGRPKADGGAKIKIPQINHISMKLPSTPLMVDVNKSRHMDFCNATSVSLECRFEYCQCTHVIRIPLNAVVEIILIDEGVPYDANHPFHLHGYKFRVLGMDRLGNSTSEEYVRMLDKKGLLKRNFKNPPVKDTVSTPDGGYTILRFHATNAGYWIFHCHIDFHVELGMALVFKIGDDMTYTPPPRNFPTCGDFRSTPETADNVPMQIPEYTHYGHAETSFDTNGNSSRSKSLFLFIFSCLCTYWLKI